MSFGQGGPAHGPDGPRAPWDDGGPGGSTPDWAALADVSASRGRRKRLFLVVGAVLSSVAVGAVVALAIVNTDGSGGDEAAPSTPVSASTSASGAPAPSFAATTPPPPPDPKDFISSAAKDKAPISADSLFPGPELTMGGTVYRRGADASTTDCASAARGDLARLLTEQGCTRLMRATYAKDGVAVTVGVALFDTSARAAEVRKRADKGNLLALGGSGVSPFCTTAVCRTTANAYGRYAYLTVAGHTGGRNVTEADRAVFRTGDDLAEFAFRQIIRRGEAQASAAAERPL
ncbi:hypothetical protein JNUCC64_21220 [Streptomyces sp. JNUCC 64]